MDDTTPDHEVSTTRAEERLRTATRSVVTGRAVLRRTVVTEERTITVQVRHEEAHLEIVPFDEPLEPGDVDSAAHLALPEFVLHREEVVVTKRLVPVERVRLQIDRVTEQQRVTAELRKERVTVETLPSTDAEPSAG